MRTLDELAVTEVFPFMFFPSSIERSEMESSDGSLVYSRTPALESSAKGSDSSCASSGKSECQNRKEFGTRLRHRCFVVTARARSFLYHQVKSLSLKVIYLWVTLGMLAFFLTKTKHVWFVLLYVELQVLCSLQRCNAGLIFFLKHRLRSNDEKLQLKNGSNSDLSMS